MQQVDLAAFYAKVDRRGDDECWPWLGRHSAAGYATYSHGENANAHRVAWRLAYGRPVPAELDHLCRNPGCVNPRHLEGVTHAENQRRAAFARTGGRCACGAARVVAARCRECFNAYHRDYRRRRREAGRPIVRTRRQPDE